MQHIAIEWAVTMLPVVLAGHGAGSFDTPFINGAPQIRCGRTLVVDFWIVRVEGVAPGPHASNGITEGNRRSEERRVGKRVSVRLDLGGRRSIKKKNTKV